MNRMGMMVRICLMLLYFPWVIILIILEVPLLSL